MYFAGFEYERAFLQYFGISLYQTDLPPYYLIVFSFDALSHWTQNSWLVTASVLMFVVFLGTLWSFHRRFDAAVFQIGKYAVFVTISIAVFPLLRAIASTSAVAQAEVIRSGHSRHVGLVFVETEEGKRTALNPSFQKANATCQNPLRMYNCQLLLIENAKDTIYVLRQGGGSGAADYIDEIPKAFTSEIIFERQ
jgi:hypothetical protein